MVKVKIQKINPESSIPMYQTVESSGVDLCAAENCIIEKGKRKLIGTGLKIAMPEGYEAHIRPRSGLALKHGITVLNTPGTIDSDYRGELKVLLINHGENDIRVDKGDRIAQLVLKRYEKIEWEECEQLEDSHRGENGFGSTGV